MLCGDEISTGGHIGPGRDLDPAIGLARAKSRGDAVAEDRYERKGLSFHQKLREGFLEVLRREPKRCRLVDASQDVDAVAEDVWSIVEGVL